MATVTTTLRMLDSTSGPISKIVKQMKKMTSAADKVNRAMSKGGKASFVSDKTLNNQSTLISNNQQILQTTQALNNRYQNLSRIINLAANSQNTLNRATNKGQQNSSSMLDKLKSKAKSYLTIDNAKKIMSASDNYMNMTAKLNLVNDGNQTPEELQNKVFAAATRARVDSSGMADSVSKLGLLAGDKFGGNTDGMIAFAELAQKAYRLGGSGAADQQAGMEMLTQGMATGKLQGNDFISIMEKAPMLAAAMSQVTGKTTQELMEMGEISADVLKTALFSAAEEINTKFKDIPKTFSDIGTELKTAALQSFGPALTALSDFLMTPQAQAFIALIVNALMVAGMLANGLVQAFTWLTDVISSLWGVLGPVLFIVGAALAAWALTQIPALIGRVSLLVYKLWGMVAPVLAANLPILLVGAAIGFVIYALYKWEDATAAVIGFVVGYYGMMFAVVFNLFASFANHVLSIAEFFANVWRDPFYAAKKLFYDFVINALQWLENLTKGIENVLEAIFGKEFNFSENMSDMLNELEEARDGLQSDKDLFSIGRFKQMDYGEAFNHGRDMGETFSHWTSGKVQGLADKIGGFFEMPGDDLVYSPEPPIETIDSIGKVDEVGKIRDNVDISSEDLKIMRELAEMNNIQNFVTLTPQISFGDTHVRQDGRTVDEIIANISEQMTEAIASGARGVYE